MRLLLALAALVLMFVPPAIAQSRRPAGYVVAVETPEGAPAPLVRREGQTLDAQVWTPLFAGDAVEAQGAAALTIETAKDKRLRVDAARSPHRVEGELGGGGRFAALASRLGDLFRAKPDASPTNLVGRADAPPRLQIGGAGAQVIPPGATIWVAWRGGEAPFTVELRGQSAKRSHDVRALASATTDAQEVRLVAPASIAGRLAVVVRDAQGREARLDATAGAAPAAPDWLRQGAPTAQTLALARAVELLERRPARYDLFAAGLAAGIDAAPARALLDRLARGERAP